MKLMAQVEQGIVEYTAWDRNEHVQIDSRPLGEVILLPKALIIEIAKTIEKPSRKIHRQVATKKIGEH